MKAEIGLFQKETASGKVEDSLGRIVTAVLVISGLALAFVAIQSGSLTAQAVTLILGIIGIGVTGKVVSGGLGK